MVDLSATFPVGATFAVAERLPLSEGESTDSTSVGELLEGSLCRVLAHESRGHRGRLLVSWDGGIGWVSCMTEGDRRPLLNQEWRSGEYLNSLREPLIKSNRLPINMPNSRRDGSPPLGSPRSNWDWL